MPGVVLPWLTILLIPIGFMLFMLVSLGFATCLPSSVKLTDSRIQRSNPNALIPARSIRRAEIIHEEGVPPQLVIEWALKRDRVVTRRFYIAPKVDLGRIEGHIRAWDRVFKDAGTGSS
jgi:hypothetical protein